jgi:ligand-binding SRPBCC domain-containing protein
MRPLITRATGTLGRELLAKHRDSSGKRPDRLHRLSRTQVVSRSLDEVFAFFSNASNLQVLTPAFLGFRFLTPLPIEMRTGARIDYSLSLFGLPLRWRTRITEWQPGVRFVDEQESGPYAFWRHTHTFEAVGDSTLIEDSVEYLEPFGPLGRVAHVVFVARTLDRIFEFRRAAIESLMRPRQNAPVAMS